MFETIVIITTPFCPIPMLSCQIQGYDTPLAIAYLQRVFNNLIFRFNISIINHWWSRILWSLILCFRKCSIGWYWSYIVKATDLVQKKIAMYYSPVQNTADFKRQAFQAHLILSHIETLLPLQLFISELWKFSNVRRSLIVTFVLNNSHSWTRSNSSEFSSLPQGPLLGVEGLRQDLVPCRLCLPQLEPAKSVMK